MPILTANQRQELIDKRDLATSTLGTYSALTFQQNLRQGVIDAQAVDDGIKAIFAFCDDDVIGNYYGEIINLDAIRVQNDLNMFYTDSRLVVPPAIFEDEVMTLGELSDDYLDIISEGIIARGNNTPPFTPTDVRRLFPIQETTIIVRISQFDGTPTIRDMISPSTWAGTSGSINEPIVNAEKFFLFYEGRIAGFSNGGRPTNTSTFVRGALGGNIGTQTGIIRTYVLTATAPTPGMGMTETNTATATVGQQFLSDEGDRIEVLVGGTASTTVTSGMGGGTTTTPANIVCGVLNTAQRVQSLAGQTNNLNLERTFFVNNANMGKSSTNLALIDARLAEVVVGGSSDATDRTRRNGEITARLTDITTNIQSFFDRRYDSANQRANFADGTLGALKGKRTNFNTFKVMIDSDTTTVTDGSEITRLKQSIIDINSQIAFSDAN